MAVMWLVAGLACSSKVTECKYQERFNFHSKRMKVAYLRAVAEELGIPPKASASELKQMIDGKLCDLNHQPQYVHVVVSGSQDIVTLQLLMDHSCK